jgi:hypothetical protein
MLNVSASLLAQCFFKGCSHIPAQFFISRPNLDETPPIDGVCCSMRQSPERRKNSLSSVVRVTLISGGLPTACVCASFAFVIYCFPLSPEFEIYAFSAKKEVSIIDR